jgi:hypothetical protein
VLTSTALLVTLSIGATYDRPAATVSPPETRAAPKTAERVEPVLVVPEIATPKTRPIPDCAWTPAAKASLVAMVRIESSSGKDAAAIAWTMTRRWLGLARFRGRSFADYIVDTSAPLRAHRRGEFESLTGYQACVLGVPRLDERGRDACRIFEGERKAAEVGAVLDAWAAGDVPDPCGGESFMWFAPWYRSTQRTRVVSCGDTANRFHTLPEISHATVLERVSTPVDLRTCR